MRFARHGEPSHCETLGGRRRDDYRFDTDCSTQRHPLANLCRRSHSRSVYTSKSLRASSGQFWGAERSHTER